MPTIRRRPLAGRPRSRLNNDPGKWKPVSGKDHGQERKERPIPIPSGWVCLTAMPQADQPRQLPLDLSHSEGRTRDHLVVSEANAAAVALIDRWPDWPSPLVVLA